MWIFNAGRVLRGEAVTETAIREVLDFISEEIGQANTDVKEILAALVERSGKNC
jgi:hypothetical protein